MMFWLFPMHRFLISLALSGLVCLAQAQIVEQDTSAPRWLACLERSGPAIDYPAADRQRQSPGFLRLSLKFTDAGQPPEATVLFRAASEAMLEEVRWHVRGYRLPCLPAGEAVTAVQEFEFKPRVAAPITWTAPRAVQAAREDGVAVPGPTACMRTPSTPPDIWGPAFQRDVVNVIAQITFNAADAAPDVELVYSSGSPSQDQSVKDYVRQYRLPCLVPGSKAYVVQQQFTYRPYGAPARVFKEAVKLTAFLSNMKDIQQARAQFDFSTMNCPFQVAWTLGKPAVDNRVGQVGEPDLNRTEFLAWLAGLEMAVRKKEFELMLGQTVIINVPCGTLNLAGEAAAARP